MRLTRASKTMMTIVTAGGIRGRTLPRMTQPDLPSMNELERHAYCAIARALAWHAHDFAEESGKGFPISEKFPSEARAIYHHFFTSDFENVADNLWKLGILRPLHEQNERVAYFAMNCEPDDSYQIAMSHWQADPRLDELLLTFVTLFGDYGAEYWGFSTQRGVPFGKMED